MIFDKKYDIFISYRHNNMTLISELVSRLERYYDVFWDQRLESGYWNEQLTKAIDNSRVVLINFNTNSLKKNTENEDWFYKEIIYSINNKKKEEIIPVCYDGFEFPDVLSMEGTTDEEKEKLSLLRDKYQRIIGINNLDMIVEKIISFISGLGIEPKEEYISFENKNLNLKIDKIVPVKSFLGRENELERIVQLIHTKDIVFISGMGGIGKTELAKKFMEEMTGEYRCIFLKYEGNLKNTLAKIEINGFDRTDFEKKEEVLKQLLVRNVVLVIDNFDFESEENIDDYIFEFCKYSCKKLITTRNLFNDLEFPCDTGFISLGSLKEDELKKIFEVKYGKNITDGQFGKILKFTDGLTLVVPILASLCVKADMSVDELCEKIENGLNGLENSESINYVKDGNRKGSVPDILRVLFNIDNISEEKKKTLCNLSLLQFIKITKSAYRELVFRDNKGNLDSFNELVDAGWIKQTGHDEDKAYYELHPLINSLVKDVLKPSFKTCREIFNFMEEKSKDVLMRDFYGRFLSEINYYDKDNYDYLASMKQRDVYREFYADRIIEIILTKEILDNSDISFAIEMLMDGQFRNNEKNKIYILNKFISGRKNKTVSSSQLELFIRAYCMAEIAETQENIYKSPDFDKVKQECEKLCKKYTSLSTVLKIKKELSKLKIQVERGAEVKKKVEDVIEKLHCSQDITDSFKLVESVWRICGVYGTFKEDVFLHFLKEDSTNEEIEKVIDATLERYGDKDLTDEYGINEGYYIGLALAGSFIIRKYRFLSYEKCNFFLNKMFENEVPLLATVMSGDLNRIKKIIENILFSKPLTDKTAEEIEKEGSELKSMCSGFQDDFYLDEFAEMIFEYAEKLEQAFLNNRKFNCAIFAWFSNFENLFELDENRKRAKELRVNCELKILGIRLKNN